MPSEGATTVAQLAADEATARRVMDVISESFDPLAAVAGASEDGPGRWVVAIHFRDPPNETAVRALIALAAGADAANGVAFATTTPQDWVTASHEGLRPIEAGRFVVHTAHYRARVPKNRIAIEIEASLAFGTGHHGTTRGCLLALDRIVKEAKKRRRARARSPHSLSIRPPRRQHAIASFAMRRAGPQRSLPNSGLGLPAVGQSGATAFPPPLWGRDRERGTTAHCIRFVRGNQQKQPSVVLTLGVLSPPLSLSLPHKGGGNRVERIFATHAKRLRVDFQRRVRAVAHKGDGSRPSLPQRQCPIALALRNRPRAILDIGTGTGVLAIAAARVLRQRAMASDIDPVAVRVARANVRLNGALALIELARADGLAARHLHGRYEVVFANILLDPVQRLATPIARNLAPGGRVVLSGLLRNQAVAALAPYIARGLALKARIPLEGWMTLVLERRK